MKNIEAILKEAGIELTDDQRKAVTAGVAENYKPVSDWQKQVDKTKAAEQRATDAEEALKKFDGVDVDGFNKTIDEWKQKAADAEKKAAAQLLKRDQEDWLKAKFDAMGVKSERIRKALAAEITGEDGLKWKDGAFLGFDDYVKAENEKDHFYDTDEEKTAEGRAPKFTDRSDQGKGASKVPEVPRIW